MKKLHFKLFKRLSCIVVFTTLFFSHVQAKGIDPDGNFQISRVEKLSGSSSRRRI